MDMLKKVSEMEKAAYKDYTDICKAYNLDPDFDEIEETQVKKLRYRWLGILEVKQELLRMQ